MSKTCPKCKKVNNDNMTFCAACGAKLPTQNASSPPPGQKTYQGSTSIPQELKSIVIESTEQLKCILSNSVAQTFASGGGFGTSKIFFTNKRFYAKVNSFSIRKGITTDNIIVPLENISGTKIVHKNPIVWIILAALSIIPVVIEYPQALILTAIFAIMFFVQRGTYLSISHPGATEELKVSMYSYENVTTFQKQLSLEINR